MINTRPFPSKFSSNHTDLLSLPSQTEELSSRESNLVRKPHSTTSFLHLWQPFLQSFCVQARRSEV